MVFLESKKVIMLIVDTLMSEPLEKAIAEGKAPLFKFLRDNGDYYTNLVTPFPTMSVNIDSTLLTGEYCDKHRVPGLVWFNQNENRIINYGSAYKEIRKLGTKKSLNDALYRLNNEHLSKDLKTIYEELESTGNSSGAINALLYRGPLVQTIQVPKLVALLFRLEQNGQTSSPSTFSYGDLAKLNPVAKFNSIWHKYGFNDRFTIHELKHLIQSEQLPDFTMAYLPDLDKSVHKNGRMDTKGIEKVDQKLQELFNSFSSWEEGLKNYRWILFGDNGQAGINADRNEALIDLREVFKNYKTSKLRTGVTKEDDLILCVNHRSAYIYTVDKQRLPLDKMASILQEDKRIDAIAWKEKNKVHVLSGEKGGKLIFEPNGDSVDEYQQTWEIEGELEILDIRNKDQQIEYGDYPDALARLYSSLHSHEGNFVVVSAKPGHEFIGESTPTHVGGASHGGLHKQDSVIPMIVTGIDSTPAYFRMKELKDWVLSLIKNKEAT